MCGCQKIWGTGSWCQEGPQKHNPMYLPTYLLAINSKAYIYLPTYLKYLAIYIHTYIYIQHIYTYVPSIYYITHLIYPTLPYLHVANEMGIRRGRRGTRNKRAGGSTEKGACHHLYGRLSTCAYIVSKHAIHTHTGPIHRTHPRHTL